MDPIQISKLNAGMLYSASEIKVLLTAAPTLATLDKTKLKGSEKTLRDITLPFPFTSKNRDRAFLYALLIPVSEGMMAVPVVVGKGGKPIINAGNLHFCDSNYINKLKDYYKARAEEFVKFCEGCHALHQNEISDIQIETRESDSLLGRTCTRGNRFAIIESGGVYYIGTVNQNGDAVCRYSQEKWDTAEKATAACVSNSFSARHPSETEFCHNGKGCCP